MKNDIFDCKNVWEIILISIFYLSKQKQKKNRET